MIEHWDGSQWSIVPSANSPNGPRSPNYTSSTDLVSRFNKLDSFYAPYVAHPTVNSSQLHAVSAASANDVWTVGCHCCGAEGLTSLIEHWDGAQWSVVFSPNLTLDNNYLFGVEAVSSANAWTVGYYGNSIWQTLTEHYAAICATPTPSLTPISTVSVTTTDTSNLDC